MPLVLEAHLCQVISEHAIVTDGNGDSKSLPFHLLLIIWPSCIFLPLCMMEMMISHTCHRVFSRIT